MSGSYNIDAIFNMNKLKFDVLDSELRPNINMKADQVNIFISLDSAYKYLMNKDIESYMMKVYDEEDLQYALISNTINLAQHYRLYFAKLGIPNKVYIYCNDTPNGKSCKNTEYIPSYRELFNDTIGLSGNLPFVRDILERVLKTTGVITRYVNEVYLIKTNTIESSVVPYVIYQDQDPSKTYQNFIVTEDTYDYQYVNHGFIMINPKSNKVVTEDNLMSVISDKYKVVSIKSLPKAYFVPLLISKGNTRRSINKLEGVTPGSLVKSVTKCIKDLIVTENTTYIGSVKLVVPEECRDKFEKYFNAIDIPTQYKDLSATDRFSIFSQIIDKFDDISLYDLNDKFFKNHLLMIVDTKSHQLNLKSD